MYNLTAIKNSIKNKEITIISILPKIIYSLKYGTKSKMSSLLFNLKSLIEMNKAM